MQYSYSRVDLYKRCPYHFKLKYLDKLTEIADTSATSPLILGHAIHTGIEKGKEVMLQEYYNSYPIVDDLVINEAIKLEILLEKVNKFLERFDGLELIHEYEINEPNFIGYVDLIVKRPNGECLVVDFKYSNSVEHYRQSSQLDVYKYYLDKQGFNVTELAFLFIPKINTRQGKQEELYAFRKRIVEQTENSRCTWVPMDYSESKVREFMYQIYELENEKTWAKNPHGECFICNAIKQRQRSGWSPFSIVDYLETKQDENGGIIEMIKQNNRKNKKTIWIYGEPFSGKTTFASDFPNPLMINTDGNTKFIDIDDENVRFIADKVEKNGRIVNRTLAWDILDKLIIDLEVDSEGYETIVIDLLEDVYTFARYKIYDEIGIEHESDSTFKAWDMVTTLFLTMVKRIVALDVDNIVLISHEDTTKDITKRSGDKITSIQPNIREKVAKKVAGMVDLVGRAIVVGEEHKFNFKEETDVFSGCRIPTMPTREIELDYDALDEAYEQAYAKLEEIFAKKRSKKAPKKKEVIEEEKVEEVEKPKRKRRTKKVETPEVEEVEETSEEEVVEEELPKRKRRTKKEVVEEEKVEEVEKPKRRRRTRRSAE